MYTSNICMSTFKISVKIWTSDMCLNMCAYSGSFTRALVGLFPWALLRSFPWPLVGFVPIRGHWLDPKTPDTDSMSRNYCPQRPQGLSDASKLSSLRRVHKLEIQPKRASL